METHIDNMNAQSILRPPGNGETGHVETSVIRDDDAFAALEADWTDLHQRARGTVFQTYTWLRTWWDIYRKPADRLYIHTVRIDGRLASVLPLYLDRVGFGRVHLNRMRMLGVYEAYGEYTLLVEREETERCARAIAGDLATAIRQPGCDMVSFYRFPPGSVAMLGLMEELRKLGLAGRYNPEVVSRVMMDLPGSWDEYMKGLSSNIRETIRRKTKLLEKKGVVVEVVRTPDPAAFDDYVRLHGQSWHSRGSEGYFVSPRFREFLSRVTMKMMADDRARLYFLKKDNVRFAAVHAFFMHDQCCFYLSGLDRDHEFVNNSPGLVLLSRVIQSAIQEQFPVFDFQGGNEEYKARLGGKPTYFAKALFWARDSRSIKVMGLLAIQGLSDGIKWGVVEPVVPFVKSLFRRKKWMAVRSPAASAHRTVHDGGHRNHVE